MNILTHKMNHEHEANKQNEKSNDSEERKTKEPTPKNTFIASQNEKRGVELRNESNKLSNKSDRNKNKKMQKGISIKESDGRRSDEKGKILSESESNRKFGGSEDRGAVRTEVNMGDLRNKDVTANKSTVNIKKSNFKKDNKSEVSQNIKNNVSNDKKYLGNIKKSNYNKNYKFEMESKDKKDIGNTKKNMFNRSEVKQNMKNFSGNIKKSNFSGIDKSSVNQCNKNIDNTSVADNLNISNSPVNCTIKTEKILLQKTNDPDPIIKEDTTSVEDKDTCNEQGLQIVVSGDKNTDILPENDKSSGKMNRNETILKEIYDKLQRTEDKLKVRLLNKIQTEIKRTSDVARIRDANWEMFNLSPLLIDILKELKFVYPSPVQVNSIPEALLYHNLVVRAKNGTGKTLSFVIPILERAIREEAETNFALVMAPTRELAMQIGKVFRKIGVNCNIEAIATFGGSHYYEDILRIGKGVGIIVGTPGRLFDLIKRNVIDIEKFKVLVLDECDKLLAQDFKESIENVVRRFLVKGEKKQIMLFSATFPVEISHFTSSFLTDPKEINLMPELYLKGVNQYYVKVKCTQKLHCLRTLIRKTVFDKCIIFCNSVLSAEKLGYRVVEMNIPCYFFHSHMHNDDRKNIFHQFTTTNDIQVLIATDLITRGIDVPDVNLVINFDFPGSTESFLHRIGRAGRFGRIGCAISMCDVDEMDEMMWIERQTGFEIKGISHPSFKAFTKESNEAS